MSQFLFTRINGVDNDGAKIQHISVLVSPDIGFKTADSKHPMFGPIVDACEGVTDVSADDMLGLFNVARGVEMALANANLSSRVAVADGELMLDGAPMSGALADHILKLLAEESGDLTGWVAFMERVEANPNEHSRKALFSWLESLGRNDDGITTVTQGATKGYLVGYKGVRDNNGSLESVNAGPAIVDGIEHKSGYVPNAVGSVIEMRREDVEHNPSIGCSRGLHVGTWNYAKAWAQGAVLEVHVDPADVVSVPTDCDAQKMRCSRYTVVKVLDAPYSTATLPVDGSDDFDDDFGWYDEDEDW